MICGAAVSAAVSTPNDTSIIFPLPSSFPRTRESRHARIHDWTPAFAVVTGAGEPRRYGHRSRMSDAHPLSERPPRPLSS
jgi:hypothetical protein